MYSLKTRDKERNTRCGRDNSWVLKSGAEYEKVDGTRACRRGGDNPEEEGQEGLQWTGSEKLKDRGGKRREDLEAEWKEGSEVDWKEGGDKERGKGLG